MNDSVLKFVLQRYIIDRYFSGVRLLAEENKVLYEDYCSKVLKLMETLSKRHSQTFLIMVIGKLFERYLSNASTTLAFDLPELDDAVNEIAKEELPNLIPLEKQQDHHQKLLSERLSIAVLLSGLWTHLMDDRVKTLLEGNIVVLHRFHTTQIHLPCL